MEFDFNLDPIWKHKDILGLDLGTKFIKVVQLEKKSKTVKLKGYGKIEVPENFIIEGIITEPEKLAEVIKEFLKEKVWGEVTASRVNASLPESKIFTRVLSLPQMNEKDLKEAIIWEASQSIPMAITDLYLDWQVIGPNQTEPKNNDVIFAAAPKSIVNSYLQLFKFLGMEPAAIETSLNAIVRAMIPTKGTAETTLVVDMGGQTTNMAIFDKVIRVTGSALIGGDDITRKIAEASNIEIKEAEKLKLGKTKDDKGLLREAVDEELTEITREAERIIKYYNEKINKENSVSKILLCGGNAVIPHLSEFFTEKLGIQTHVGNPWANISVYPIKPIPKNEASSYTNAVGLALLGVENG